MFGLREFSRRFALPHWRWYAAGFVALAATNLITLEIPQLAKSIVNSLGQVAAQDESHRIALLIIGLGVLQILVRSLSRVMIFWPGRELESQARAFLFARTMRLPYRFFLRFGMGDLIARLSNDLGQLRVFFAFGVLQFLNLVFLLSFTVSKMLSVHQTLTAIALTPMILMLGLTRILWPMMQKVSRLNQDAQGRLGNRITEAFVNVHAIQANAAHQAFIDRAEVENLEVYATNMRLILIRTVLFPMMSCMTGLAQVAVLFYGSYETIAGRLTVGDILAFNIYLGYLSFPLSALGIMLAIYQRALTSLDRLAPFVETEMEASPLNTALPATTAPALLAVTGLSFDFNTAEDSKRSFALDGLSFSLQKGQRLGIFGPVGSGKSTLFNLLTRLLEPPVGAIKVEGRDVWDYEPATLRRSLGYGLQAVHLFSASIAENLAFGLETPPSREAMEAALRQAEIWDEVIGLNDGLDTQIGERGIRLSGGQKQRLALARLFLRKPALYILDDVLAAVDNQTERRIIEHIQASGSTLLIASHRPQALRLCDQILMLSAGKIVASGTLSELQGRYPELNEESSDAT